jgi:hypothetical protein
MGNYFYPAAGWAVSKRLWARDPRKKKSILTKALKSFQLFVLTEHNL